MACNGKLDKYGPKSRRAGDARGFIKRETARLRRRLGKALLDDAPRIVTNGWSS